MSEYRHQYGRPGGGRVPERRLAIGLVDVLDDEAPPVMLGWKTFLPDDEGMRQAARVAAELMEDLSGDSHCGIVVRVLEYPYPIGCDRRNPRTCGRRKKRAG